MASFVCKECSCRCQSAAVFALPLLPCYLVIHYESHAAAPPTLLDNFAAAAELLASKQRTHDARPLSRS